MIQEVFFFLIPEGDFFSHVLREKVQNVQKEGWRVVSVIRDGDECTILCEKEAPPPIIFTLPAESTQEQIESFRNGIQRQYENGVLQNHKPIIMSGDVKMHRISNSGIQYVEITREMLDDWFGNKGVDKHSET